MLADILVPIFSKREYRSSTVFLVDRPSPSEHTDTVLDGVNSVADYCEQDEEDDDYYENDDVSFDHFCGGLRRGVGIDSRAW